MSNLRSNAIEDHRWFGCMRALVAMVGNFWVAQTKLWKCLMNTTSNLLHMKFEPMTVMISFTIAPSSLYIFEILNFSTKVNLVESITSHCGDIWKFRIWCIKAMVSHNTSSCIVLLFTLFFFFFRRGVMVNCAFSPYIFNILLLSKVLKWHINITHHKSVIIKSLGNR